MKNISQKTILSFLFLMASTLAVCQATDKIFVLTQDQQKQGSKLYDAYVEARIKREKAEFQEQSAQDAFNQWASKTSKAFGVQPGYDLSLSPDFKLARPVPIEYIDDENHFLVWMFHGWCMNQYSAYTPCDPGVPTHKSASTYHIAH